LVLLVSGWEARVREGEAMMDWTHDALAADLAKYLGENKAARLIWQDMQLGPAGSPRPDVYALPKTYSRFLPFAYEVKISRADYQRDVNAGKWQKYYAYASAVVFAVPDGMVKTTELPEGAGLIVRKAEVWRMAKAPKVNRVDNLPLDTWMKLVMDGVNRLDARPVLNEYAMRERAFKKALGEEIAKLAANREMAEWRISHEIAEHEKRLAAIRERNEQDRVRANEKDQWAAAEFDRLCTLFNLPAGAPTYRLSHAIAEAVAKLDADTRVRDLVATIEAAERALSAAKLRINASAASEDKAA
jgi:hypothetical protein